MKKRTVITLCCIIALMGAVIAAGIYSLYAGLDREAAYPAASAANVARTDTPAADETAEEAGAPAETVKTTPVDDKAAAGDPAKVVDKAAVKPAVQPAEPASYKVTNCATGKKNTLTQAADNSLSLTDHEGRKLWTIPFGGRVLPPVGEIDFYNNGKIQFLITEGTALHIIDRLGREVSGFPVKFPRKVVSGAEKATVSGKACWKFGTASAPIYFKDNKISE